MYSVEIDFPNNTLDFSERFDTLNDLRMHLEYIVSNMSVAALPEISLKIKILEPNPNQDEIPGLKPERYISND